MERYRMIKGIGDGTFGSVWRAINKQTGEIVAIKKMKKKYYSWEECMNLREVKSLRKMNHPNIVKLKEIIRENDILYFVFEYMECNLYQLMIDKRKTQFTEDEVRNWCFQIFQGLAYTHQRGYFHRDLKPENLLVTNDTLKIADFGLAHEINYEPPYTEYVFTRWYRAPEVLLQSTVYHSSVDMWAMGAIMAELLTFRPLFPGVSETDEMYKICCVIGTPTMNTWAQGLNLAKAINYEFPQLCATDLSAWIPSASDAALSLIEALCSWDPCRRPTAIEALQHPFFQRCFSISPLHLRTINSTPPRAVRQGYREERAGKLHAGVCGKPIATSLVPRLPNVNAGTCKSDNSLKKPAVQSKYRTSSWNSPGSRHSSKNMYEVADAAEKLSKLKVGTRRQAAQHAPPMKAGGWHGQPRVLLRRPEEIQCARTYTRKVAG